MATKVLDHLDFGQNDIQNALMNPRASDPGTPVNGQLWYNSTSNTLKAYINGAVETISTSAGGIGALVEDPTPDLGGPLDVLAQEIVSSTTNDIDLHSANTIILELGDAAGAEKVSIRDSGAVEVAAIDSDGNITTSGTVDGRDLQTDGTKLDGITGTNTGDEVQATESVLGIAELATQAEVDAGTDDLRIVTPLKLDTLNVTGMSWFIDEDTMATDSATQVPSQQSVKAYVDTEVASSSQGLRWKDAVRVATDAAGTLATSFENGDTVDGVVLATNDRILIKDQATGSENGIYTVNASGAPTRATDADTGAELVSATVMVEEGTANADTVWSCTTDSPITVDTTSLTFANTISANVPAATATVQGKIELATQAEVDAGSDATRAVTPNTLDNYALAGGDLGGTLGAATVNAATEGAAGKIEIATQAETDAGTDDTRAVTPLKLATYSGLLGKYAADIGNGSLTTITVTHNLGTTDVVVSLKEVSSGQLVNATVDVTGVNAIDCIFAVAPASNAIRVTVIG